MIIKVEITKDMLTNLLSINSLEAAKVLNWNLELIRKTYKKSFLNFLFIT